MKNNNNNNNKNKNMYIYFFIDNNNSNFINDGIKDGYEYPHQSSFSKINDAIKDYRLSQSW